MNLKLKAWLQLAQQLAPFIIQTVNPKLAPISQSISNGIGEAEALGEKGTVTDKLAHVQTIASNAADVVNTIHGSVVLDKASLAASVQEATDTVVAVTNLIQSKTTPPESTDVQGNVVTGGLGH